MSIGTKYPYPDLGLDLDGFGTGNLGQMKPANQLGKQDARGDDDGERR